MNNKLPDLKSKIGAVIALVTMLIIIGSFIALLISVYVLYEMSDKEPITLPMKDMLIISLASLVVMAVILSGGLWNVFYDYFIEKRRPTYPLK